jgi:hypothetical protein
MAEIPLDDPVVARLLGDANLARLAYIDQGKPKVVPIWFDHIDGKIVMITGPKAAKAKALARNASVALTIDSPDPPYKVLLVDGEAALEHVEGMAPEYRPIVERYLGPAAEAYLANVLPRVKRQVRIVITPTSHRIFDFVQRYPKSLS